MGMVSAAYSVTKFNNTGERVGVSVAPCFNTTQTAFPAVKEVLQTQKFLFCGERSRECGWN